MLHGTAAVARADAPCPGLQTVRAGSAQGPGDPGLSQRRCSPLFSAYKVPVTTAGRKRRCLPSTEPSRFEAVATAPEPFTPPQPVGAAPPSSSRAVMGPKGLRLLVSRTEKGGPRAPNSRLLTLTQTLRAAGP